MKTRILILLHFVIISSAISQNKIESEPCYFWDVMPVFYNNIISDTTIASYWENYWHYWSGDNSKLIPDTLLIKLNLIPSISILDLKTIPEVKYTMLSTFQLKYGSHGDSYLVINPRLSEPIILHNDIINLKEIFEKFINTNSMGYSFYPIAIPLKELLDSLNIYIHDQVIDYSRSPWFSLNQIIINTYLIDADGKQKCWYEFTFPVNGAYSSGNCCRFGF